MIEARSTERASGASGNESTGLTRVRGPVLGPASGDGSTGLTRVRGPVLGPASGDGSTGLSWRGDPVFKGHRFTAAAALGLSSALVLAFAGCREGPSRADPPPTPPAAAPPSAPANPVSAPSSEPASKPDQSISYVEGPGPCDGSGPCPCLAPNLFHGLNALKRVGIKVGDLKEGGVPCLLGDFDGNGHEDAAFLGPEKTSKKHTVVLLLFDEGGLAQHAELPQPVSSDLGLAKVDDTRSALADGERRFIYADGRFRVGVPAAPTSR